MQQGTGAAPGVPATSQAVNHAEPKREAALTHAVLHAPPSWTKLFIGELRPSTARPSAPFVSTSCSSNAYLQRFASTFFCNANDEILVTAAQLSGELSQRNVARSFNAWGVPVYFALPKPFGAQQTPIGGRRLLHYRAHDTSHLFSRANLPSPSLWGASIKPAL
ncbi:unnamed protein product, partial [Iphiclides podalirius]